MQDLYLSWWRSLYIPSLVVQLNTPFIAKWTSTAVVSLLDVVPGRVQLTLLNRSLVRMDGLGRLVRNSQEEIDSTSHS